jgi:hypothetical protein
MLANQVMVGLLAHDLILGASVAQVGLANDLQVVQRLQCAIDGREIHIAAVKGHPIVDLFGASVAF